MNPEDLLWIDYKVKDLETDELLEEKNQQLISIEKSTFPKSVKEKLFSSSVDDTIEVIVEKPYGNRDPAKIRVVPIRAFHKNRINPVPGLPVTLDGVYAVVKSVSGGRVVVDFNHPLAGRTVKYVLKIRSLVVDTVEKIKAIAKVFKIDEKDYTIEKIEKKGKNENNQVDSCSYKITIDKEKYDTIFDSFKANLFYFISGEKIEVVEK